MAADGRTPLRPTPRFFAEETVFSTKKAREGTPRNNPPPRPPAKSCPPQSRVFSHKSLDKAQLVSFRKDALPGQPAVISRLYTDSSKETLFEQCFVKERQLGAGSFGEVYKVRSKEDGKYYAVKRSRDAFKGEMDRKRKLEEVAKHELLPHHPNCVQFVRAWEEKQHLYIQTELCDMSLSHFAESNHEIPERLIWNYLIDLLMAVKHLHDHDLVHMDIKPENIFLARDGTCKLGDFGLILDLSKGSDLSEAQEGDPKYLAPELLDGKFTKAADIFSLGMTIFELASDLDLPRGGEGWHQLRHGQLPEEFIKGKISDELKSVIKLMTEPESAQRPSAADLLLLPSARLRMTQRKLDLFVRQQSLALVGAFLLLWSFLLSLWDIATKPFASTRTCPSPPSKRGRWGGVLCDGVVSSPLESSRLRDLVVDSDDDTDKLGSDTSLSSDKPRENCILLKNGKVVSSASVSPLSIRDRRAQSTGAAILRKSSRIAGIPIRTPDFGASPAPIFRTPQWSPAAAASTHSAESSSVAAAGSAQAASPARLLPARGGPASTSAVRKRLAAAACPAADEEVKINLEPRNLLGMFESASHGPD